MHIHLATRLEVGEARISHAVLLRVVVFEDALAFVQLPKVLFGSISHHKSLLFKVNFYGHIFFHEQPIEIRQRFHANIVTVLETCKFAFNKEIFAFWTRHDRIVDAAGGGIFEPLKLHCVNFSLQI